MTIDKALAEVPELKEAYDGEPDTRRIIDMAKKLCVELIFVPKSKTWFLQPLDVGVMGPMKQIMSNIWLERYRCFYSSNYHMNWTSCLIDALEQISAQCIQSSFEKALNE